MYPMASGQFRAPPKITYTKLYVKSVAGVEASGADNHYSGEFGAKRKAKLVALGHVDNDSDEDRIKCVDRNGRSIRTNRGKRSPRPPGFFDTRNLVVDSSEGEDYFVTKKNDHNDSDSDDEKLHTVASPDLRTMRDPSTPPLSPLPPAAVPLPTVPESITEKDVPFITASNPFAGISPAGSVVQPLKIMINVTKGYEGRVDVNIDYHSIMESMRPLHTFGGGQRRGRSATTRSSAVPSAVEPLQIQVDLPTGYEGRAVTNVDFGTIMESMHPVLTPGFLDRDKYTKTLAIAPSSGISPKSRVMVVPASIPASKGVGFLSLSGEIRNRIYRLILKGEPVHFIDGTNFERSGSLLRTCKQIYTEARLILYRENEFIFERDSQKCGVFWQPIRTEIGYSNVRRFLEMIGPVNIGLIQFVGFAFDDALPSSAPDKNNEGRRYANDCHCLYALKLLAKHGKLQRVVIGLYGRREISSSKDTEFLNALRAVPAASVVFRHPRHKNNYRCQYLDTKTREYLKRMITEGMQKAYEAKNKE